MQKYANPLLYWFPRIVSLLFVAFLMLFSLDVFGEGLSFWQTALALFMHNVPALILLIAVVISWKYEIVGGVVFILAGLLYIVLICLGEFEWYKLAWAVQISGPAFAVGILYILGWLKKKNLKKSAQ